MYYTFDTNGFTEADYEAFKHIYGFSVRKSYGEGEHNRGMLVLADSLIFKDMKAVTAALPSGYTITDSAFPNSAGCLHAPVRPAPAADTCLPAGNINTDTCSGADVIRRTIVARGASAALSLLSDFTVLGILTKSTDIFPLLQEILASAAVDDYASCNILDIYKGIPKLRVMYWEDEKKREQLQQQFDRLCSGACTLSDIRNPYDVLYQKGMAALLHITIRP